jgi:hypothetical protein
VRFVPIEISVITMVAPWTTAPVASVATPTTVPVLVACPKAAATGRDAQVRSIVRMIVNVEKREIDRVMIGLLFKHLAIAQVEWLGNFGSRKEKNSKKLWN